MPPPGSLAVKGGAVISLPDIRWGRCDIKSTALLAAVLGKQQAKDVGAVEAWLVDRDGFVTEGTSSNAWIITKDGTIRTRPPSTAILSGITRQAVLNLCRGEGLTLVEEPFTVAEAQDAQEAMTTSSTALVVPVTAIDGVPVGDGAPGPLVRKLREVYIEAARNGGVA